MLIKINRSRIVFLLTAITAHFALLLPTTLLADAMADRLANADNQAQKVKNIVDKMSTVQRNALSSGAWNLAQMAKQSARVSAMKTSDAGQANALAPQVGRQSTALVSANPTNSGPVPVSDPTHDLDFSSLSGMTQSETSTAWCGNNVVVGYNDSGSFFESQFNIPPRQLSGLSFSGIARSTDGGLTFKDLGYLNPGPNVADQLAGDPVLACSNASTFYNSSIFLSGNNSAIAVSKSINGGATFGNPVAAVSKPLTDGHFLDKPWMTVDPSNSNRLFVTYTDFDNSGSSVACPLDTRTAIELVRSTDGGKTWGKPVPLTEVCGFTNVVQGSQVVVNQSGQVYVAWETITDSGSEINISKSTDQGLNFNGPIKVTDVKPVGAFGIYQGGFRSALEFPSLAVDRSRTANAGTLYLTWNNGNLEIGDKISTTYAYADIMMTRSVDGGLSWSEPVRVNRNKEPLATGLGSDQYQPGIAVDRQSGRIAICYYDRRRDSFNFLIDRYCSNSVNGGGTWSELKVTAKSFPVIISQDFLINPIYMGDYDVLATDTTGANPGFIGAYADNGRGNPNVLSIKF